MNRCEKRALNIFFFNIFFCREIKHLKCSIRTEDNNTIMFDNSELRKAKNIYFINIDVFFRGKGQRFFFQRK